MNVLSEITTRESALGAVQVVIRNARKIQGEYQKEHSFILNSLATFAWFLKHNAITAYNDSYQTYVQYLIDR